jgi:lipopolysaccharide/colanic/teichoic acid biosynthesis glycosyltransferase
MTTAADNFPNPRVLIAVTSPLACIFYRGVLGHLKHAGFDPTILSSPGPFLEKVSAHEGVAHCAIPMKREIGLLRDAEALGKIYRTIRRLRPEIVDASTPKAGLLTGLAAWLARVPCRVYTLRGLRLETATGLKRAVLWLAEWTACACAHQVVCVSPSLRARAIGLGLVSAGKSTVLAKGSQGVDLKRFSPEPRDSPAAENLRRTLGIPAGVPVLGFVGRFVRDKGIGELVDAFLELRASYPELRLLLVGDFEDGDPVQAKARRVIEADPAIVRPGFVPDAAPYYSQMDVLVLPTYREGFPGVPLEAQASALPVVTTSATGAIDSVVDGVTGLVVPVGDAKSLAAAIRKLLADPELRSLMGKAGRRRMEQEFHPEVIWDAWVALYRKLLQEPPTQPALSSRLGGWAKRGFDLLLASAALLLLSPLMFAIAAVIRVLLGSPVIFRQPRAGFRGTVFECLKFRTMTDERDPQGELLPDHQRLTRLGRCLRTSSLDELPELWNVIRGEMSLVGPRPLLARYLERYSPEQMRRHEVKPGVTGWTQINGRNSLSWDEKFALDLWYVDHQSFWLDLSILAKTIPYLIRREGVSSPSHATMPEFMGHEANHHQGSPL